MSRVALSMLRQSMSWGSNVLVLSVLIGLGYWGHTNHWKIPKFSDVAHSAEAGNSDDAAVSPSDSGANVQLAVVTSVATTHGSSATGPHDPKQASRPRIEFLSAEAVRAAGLKLGLAESRPMAEFVTANGVVTYHQNHLAQLSARVPGTVWRVDKKVGQSVRAGEVLALIDAVDVGRAKASLLQTLVDTQLKAENLDRLRSIRNVIPERQMREAEADLREARISRYNAQQTLINLGLSVRVEDFKGKSDEEIARDIQFLGLPGVIVSTLDPTMTTANLIPVVAPFDGVVIRREIVTGEVVAPSETQFVVADVRTMWIELNVRKEDASRLALGQELVFTSDGVPNDIHSTLDWVGTEVDIKTRTVLARARVDNPLLHPGPDKLDSLRVLRANTYGTGRIRVREQPLATVVPASAIQWEGSQHVVFVPCDEKSFEVRRVRLGTSRDGYTEVLDGVAAGEKVVTAGSHLLKSEIVQERISGETASAQVPGEHLH